MVVLFVFFYDIHLFEGKGTESTTETVARTFGVLSTVFCGLALCPTARGNDILTICFGVSFESAVKYHRVLGGLTMVFAVGHCSGFLVFWKQNGYSKSINPFGDMPPETEDNPMSAFYHADNWTIRLMQACSVMLGNDRKVFCR